jgi:small GTP-binding protein
VNVVRFLVKNNGFLIGNSRLNHKKNSTNKKDYFVACVLLLAITRRILASFITSRDMSATSSNDSCILAIIGDGSVGKSSLIAAFRNDNFQKIYKQTVGCDFYEKVVTLSGRTISLRVWDIGGQSMNSKNLPEYLSSSDLVFIVYDVTNSESFANVEDWLCLAKKYSPEAHIHIVGNKVC